MQDFTTKKFLDTAGLTTLWTFISDLFTTKKSVGTHKYIIDASSKDNNLYYPVVMILPDDKVTRIECVVALNSNIPSWSDNEKGFTVRKVWESNGSGWGKATVRRNIYVADYNYANNDPVIKIDQLSDKSAEYVYVRGGGKYYFYTTNDVEPVLYDEYIDSSLSILSPISYNDSLKIKVTNLTSDNLNDYALTNDEIDLLWSANISFGSYASAMASSDETINSIGIGDYDE